MAAVVVTLSALALRASGATSLDATTAASLADNKFLFLHLPLPWHYELTFSCSREFQHTISSIVKGTALRNIASDLGLLSFSGTHDWRHDCWSRRNWKGFQGSF